jgi:hypothetical protein
MRNRLLLFAALCFSVACADERPRFVVAADSASFDRAPLLDSPPVAAVTFVVTSRAGPVGFVPSCNAQPVVAVEQAVSSGWTQYNGGYCIGIYPEAAIEMHGGNRVFGTVLIPDPGRYRLRLDYSATRDFEKTFTALSEPFEVR